MAENAQLLGLLLQMAEQDKARAAEPSFIERGQDRTRRLGETMSEYIPPELRSRLEFLGQMINPVTIGSNAMATSRDEVFAPGKTMGERGRGVLDVATGMAEILTPAAGAAMRVRRGADLMGDAAQMSIRVPRNQAPSLGEAAASVDEIGYSIGDRLRPADASFSPSNGRPGALAIPDRGRFEPRRISPIEEAAREYMKQRGTDDFGSVIKYPDFDESRAGAIAAAYDAMKHSPSDPLVKRAYDAMIGETLDQYNALKGTGIDFRFLKEGMEDPYARSPALGYQDMVENGRLWVFPTDFGFGSNAAFDAADNPLLKGVGRIGDKDNAVANDAFRVVHDAFGHYGPGNPFFRHQGEERAWVEHSRMYSPEARGAMTSETRGQNSWLNFGPHGAANRKALGGDTIFADQKVGLLPEWMWTAGGVNR